MKISTRVLSLQFFLVAMYMYLFIDIIRRFNEGLSFAVILVDVFLLCSAFCLYLQMYRQRISVVASPALGPYILMVMIALAVMVTNLIGLMPSATVFLISLKVYVLPMLFMVFGMYLYQVIIDGKDYIKIVRELKRYTYVIMSIGLLQYLFSLFGISFLAPMEHSIHSWGREEVELISSGFASSKKYARILIFCSIFTIVIASYHNVRVKWFHFFALVSVLISGSREGAVVFILFTVIFIYKNPQYLVIKHRKLLLFFSALPAIFLIRHLGESYTYISFLFSIDDPFGFLKRIVMLMPLFMIDYTNDIFIFGLGASRYGVETKFIPELREAVDPLVLLLTPDFVSPVFGAVTFVDSGAFKLIVEFGYTGVIILLTMLSIVSFPFFSALLARSRSILMFGVSFLAFFWVILFMKGHSMISDVIVSSFFYILLGFVSAGRNHEKKNTNLL